VDFPRGRFLHCWPRRPHRPLDPRLGPALSV